VSCFLAIGLSIEKLGIAVSTSFGVLAAAGLTSTIARGCGWTHDPIQFAAPIHDFERWHAYVTL